ncbi:hypothetical protein FUT69_06920, partial [Xylella taiwanensis]
MPIHVITATPGGGKTALMMEMLLAESERAQRPIFAAGIDGLAPGLAADLADPRQWNAKNDQGEYLVPHGAIIFIDEAWKWFGSAFNASHQPTPPHALELAEHRHRGLDFVWTTQLAHKQLYPFVRGLIGRHTFVKRRFGTSWLDVYDWDQLVEETDSSTNRQFSRHSVRRLPKHVYKLYKSAEVHTIKMRLPWQLVLIPLMVVVIVACVFYAYRSLIPSGFSSSIEGTRSTPGTGGDASPKAGEASRGEGPRWPTVTAYAKDHLPRFASMPWTAPIYDHRSPTVDPQLICMSGGAGLDAQGVYKGSSCTCYTEQGTVYDISQLECRTIARRGPVYNPYRERVQEHSAMQQGQVSSSLVQGSTAKQVSVSAAGA